MPSDRLTVIMINQTKILTQPDDMRRTVMANEVLLQHAARIEKVPARLVMSKKISRSRKLNCASGLPNPMLIATETKAFEAASASYMCRVCQPWPSGVVLKGCTPPTQDAIRM